jgi:flagellar basal-body rod protein FlgC
MNTANSAMSTYQTFLDATANNIANINTIEPTSGAAFQAQYVAVQAQTAGAGAVGGGVEVTGLKLSDPAGRVTSDPQNPLADANGNVRMPDIDMGEQMGNLIMAQRAFQANSDVIGRAKDIYQYAIDIGKKA